MTGVAGVWKPVIPTDFNVLAGQSQQFAYINVGGSLQQITANVMALGTSYELQLFTGWSNDVDVAATRRISLIDENGSVLVSVEPTLLVKGIFQLVTLEYTAQAADVGKRIGILLECIGSPWATFERNHSGLHDCASGWYPGRELHGR